MLTAYLDHNGKVVEPVEVKTTIDRIVRDGGVIHLCQDSHGKIKVKPTDNGYLMLEFDIVCDWWAPLDFEMVIKIMEALKEAQKRAGR